MADSYELVLADLQSMSGRFAKEADVYDASHSDVTPPIAATGDGSLDGTLGAVMEALDILHAQMGETIREHGVKLKAARESYERHDVDAHGLFDDLMEG